MTRRANWLMPLVVLCLAAAMALGSLAPVPAEAKKTAAATPTPVPSTYDAAKPENLTPKDIKGEAAIVMDASTGRALFEKNADKRLYPASTTKVMTALLALEYGHLDDVITVPAEISKTPAGSSLVPLRKGETMTFSDLLYGLMLRSGNDAAIAVAVIVAGSVDKFAAMMNQKAKELGCQNTHFTNPHGFQDLSHYSTARDLAIITREAMKSETFRRMVATVSHTIPANNKGKARTIKTTDAMINKSSSYYYEYAIGVKTGSTSQAGQCFVGAAEKDGATLVSVTLQSTKAGKWSDTRRLMEYGFTRYERYAFPDLYALSPLYASAKRWDGEGAETEALKLQLVPGGSIDGYSVQCVPEDLEAVAEELASRVSVQYTSRLVAPIRAGEVLGSVTLALDDGSALTGTVAAGQDVAEVIPTPTPAPTPTPTVAPTPTPAPEAGAGVLSGPDGAAPAAQDAEPASAQGGAAAPEQDGAAVTSRPGELAPWSGSTDLALLLGLGGLFALVLLAIAALRIRHAVRRRRYLEMRRRRQAAYMRAHRAR